MTYRLKALERVLTVRERLRDAASATAANADRTHAQADAVRIAARSAVETLYSNAPARMSSVSSIGELVRFDAERVLSQHVAREADKAAEKARAEAERSRTALRARSRDVRVFEKAILDTRTARELHESKREQTMADDLTSWRFSG